MVRAILIIVFFLLIGGLMMSRKLPTFLALIIMAVGVALIAGVPFIGTDADGNTIGIFKEILEAGSYRMASAMAAIIFGGWYGRMVTQTGVSRALITKAAELGGDRPLVISLVLYAVLSFLWTNLSGLGAIIMTGSIAIPIMMSVGIPAVLAASIFLLAVTTGFNFNFYQWQTFMGLTGVSQAEMQQFATCLFVITVLVSVAFILIQFKKNGIKFAFSAAAEDVGAAEDEDELIKGWRGVLCMLAPLVPLVLVMAFKLQIIPAFLCGIIWLAVFSAGGFKKKMNMLSKTAFKALEDTAPVIWLLVGIGMLVVAVMHPTVKAVLQPLLTAVVPSTRIPYILFFAILAPLSLYRGPLNLFGMGSGICAIIVAAGILSPQAAMGGFVAVERLQSVGCPTNSQNAWTCSYVGLDVNVITKKLLPALWTMAALGAVVAGFLYM
ncbi:MAG: C4-dicarboxylate ABC transporter [Faecousia sp.]